MDTPAVVGGRFVVRRVAATGGMGRVFEAVDLLTGANVALKLMQDPSAPRELERFTRESETLAALRHPGMQRFDAVVWEGRPNHFHLIEAWSDRKARNAHVLAEHTRQFRTKVTPFEGALYDERLYQPLR